MEKRFIDQYRRLLSVKLARCSCSLPPTTIIVLVSPRLSISLSLLIFRLLIQQLIYLGVKLGQTSPSLSRSEAALVSARRIILTIVAMQALDQGAAQVVIAAVKIIQTLLLKITLTATLAMIILAQEAQRPGRLRRRRTQRKNELKYRLRCVWRIGGEPTQRSLTSRCQELRLNRFKRSISGLEPTAIQPGGCVAAQDV
jgi:hypothetical protein